MGGREEVQGALSSATGSWQSLCGVAGGKTPENIWHFYIVSFLCRLLDIKIVWINVWVFINSLREYQVTKVSTRIIRKEKSCYVISK